MKLDYHNHFEKGSYDEAWVEGFFTAAKERGIDEVGISEHSHTFTEFEPLYYKELITDDSFVGMFQKKWLGTNKFKYNLDDYFRFMAKLKKNHAVKTGIEVCNFRDAATVGEILGGYDFDYIIGSVHYINGWAYDCVEIIDEWKNHSLDEIYENYTTEIEMLAEAGLYDILGHPFNIRLFKFFPDFDVTPFLNRAVRALKKANMAIDVNTGTLYRYPVAEISPYGDFMRLAAQNDLPMITSSDAHQPADCGRFIDDAIAYAKKFGYEKTLRFTERKREFVAWG